MTGFRLKQGPYGPLMRRSQATVLSHSIQHFPRVIGSAAGFIGLSIHLRRGKLLWLIKNAQKGPTNDSEIDNWPPRVSRGVCQRAASAISLFTDNKNNKKIAPITTAGDRYSYFLLLLPMANSKISIRGMGSN